VDSIKKIKRFSKLSNFLDYYGEQFLEEEETELDPEERRTEEERIAYGISLYEFMEDYFSEEDYEDLDHFSITITITNKDGSLDLISCGYNFIDIKEPLSIGISLKILRKMLEGLTSRQRAKMGDFMKLIKLPDIAFEPSSYIIQASGVRMDIGVPKADKVELAFMTMSNEIDVNFIYQKTYIDIDAWKENGDFADEVLGLELGIDIEEFESLEIFVTSIIDKKINKKLILKN
jgi:hypothetical protein